MVQTIVILGGAVGGLHIAHALLKKNNKDIKVILVTKVRTGLFLTPGKPPSPFPHVDHSQN